jgi:hypothetical protein
MRCVDINPLVYAHRPESPDHEEYRAWLDEIRQADEPLAIPPLVLSGFIRIVTHPRIFKEPTSVDTAWTFVHRLVDSPASMLIKPGPRHLEIFERLCRNGNATGNLVPDAFLAAIAIEQGAVFFSADRGLARFSGLDLRHPLAER